MIRYSNANKILQACRYVRDHKKPRAIQPNTPNKYLYEVKYNNAALPGMDMGMPDHRSFNPFNQMAENKYELMRYRYDGQWWQGAFAYKLVIVAMPLVFFLLIRSYEEEKNRKGDPFYTNTVFLDHGMTRVNMVPDLR